MYRSSIIKFINEQSYVDYILDFRLYQINKQQNLTKVSAQTARSILVSVPFADSQQGHVIKAINTDTLHSYKDTLESDNILGYNPLSQLTLEPDEANPSSQLGSAQLSNIRIGE